jgi:hypothetical protein
MILAWTSIVTLTNKFAFPKQFKVRPENVILVHRHFVLKLVSFHCKKLSAIYGPIRKLNPNKIKMPDSPLQPNLDMLYCPFLWI